MTFGESTEAASSQQQSELQRIQNLPSQSGDSNEKVDKDVDEETISSTRVVINPQELSLDNDDSSSIRLGTSPRSSIYAGEKIHESTVEPPLYITGVWTPSHPKDWRDGLEHGPDPVFASGRHQRMERFMVMSGLSHQTSRGMIVEDGSRCREGEHGLESSTTEAASGPVPSTRAESDPEKEKTPGHCMDLGSTVGKLLILIWCLFAVAFAVICHQILHHARIFPDKQKKG